MPFRPCDNRRCAGVLLGAGRAPRGCGIGGSETFSGAGARARRPFSSVPKRKSVRSRPRVTPWRIGPYRQGNGARAAVSQAPAAAKQLRMQDTRSSLTERSSCTSERRTVRIYGCRTRPKTCRRRPREAGEESVDTCGEMAGLAGRAERRPTAPQGQAGRFFGNCWRSRARTPVASLVRHSDHPRRPARGSVVVSRRSRRCSCRGRNVEYPPRVNVSGRYRKWPVFSRPVMADSRLERGHEPASALPRRPPPSQRGALPDRDRPHALAPADHRLRSTSHRRGLVEERHHPLPEALRRPGGLPRTHRRPPLRCGLCRWPPDVRLRDHALDVLISPTGRPLLPSTRDRVGAARGQYLTGNRCRAA